MENLAAMRKFKIIISCLVVVFVAALVFAMVSFVHIGNARRANAEYERQIERLKEEHEQLEDDVDYLESDEGKRDNGLLPDGECEINVK